MSLLTRESAVLAGGACGSFGGGTPLGMTGPIDEAGLSDGCYRYTLSGTDRVGNSASIATIVRVDTSAPTGGAVRANGVDALPGGSDSITANGSWSVTRNDFADAESGLVSSTLTRQQGVLERRSLRVVRGNQHPDRLAGRGERRDRVLPLRPHWHQRDRPVGRGVDDRSGRQDRTDRRCGDRQRRGCVRGRIDLDPHDE